MEATSNGCYNRWPGTRTNLAYAAIMSFITKVQALRNIFSSNPVVRRNARFKAANRISQRLGGFVLYRSGLGWLEDGDFLRRYLSFEESPRRHPNPKDYALYSFAKSTACLGGDTVECGVFRGKSSYFICDAYRMNGDHIHHAFDSFEGVSEPTEDDVFSDPGLQPWKKGDYSAQLATAQETLSEFDNVRFYKGWIPDRFFEVAEKSFSLVHIDVDLYGPTRESLEFFYPRLVSGGVLICDDYDAIGCPGARKACDEFLAGKPERHMINVTTGQGVLIKR